MAQVKLKRIEVTILESDVAQRVSSGNIRVSFYEIHNKTGNSVCYPGDDPNVDNTWIPVNAGVTKSYNASEESSSTQGDNFDLRNLYIRGTAGDVIIVQYLAVEG